MIEPTVAAMEGLGARRARIVRRAGADDRGKGGLRGGGGKLRAEFVREDADAARFFAPGAREGKHLLDLPG